MSKAVFGRILIALALIISAKPLHAKSSFEPTKELAPDAIFKRYKNAVVRIEVFLHGASLGVGSGFFISRTGEIATSLHVIRPFLSHPDTDIKIKLASGRVFSNVKVGACSDARGIDLCLLKVEYASATNLPVTTLPTTNVGVTPGEAIVAIGHPRGLDFSISKGIVSAVRGHPSGWNEVQIDAAISPGNSGGPIINRHGQAIGVVYQFERDGQNLNFGILTSEVARLQTAKLPYLDLTEGRKDFFERSRRLARRATERWVKPAVQSFNDIRVRPTGLKWMRSQLGTTTFLMMLPDLFQNCEKSDGDGESSATSCSTAGGDLVVTVQKRPRSLEGSLASYRGRKLVEARPLAIVERLEAEGTWERNKLGKTSFLSRPSPARCSPIQKKSVVANDESSTITIRKQGFFSAATGICRFETENDSEPGAISASQWIEVGDQFYGINIWSSDPGRLAFLQSLGDLILVSAGTSSDDVLVSYRANLRPGLRRNFGSPSVLSSEFDVADSYSDETSTVSIAHTIAVPPSQMNRSFQRWVKTLGKTAVIKPSEIAAVEIASHPARTGAWVVPYPADRRRNALFMMTATFTPKGTWLLYELQPLPPLQNGNRAPSTSIATDIERFRSWTQEFEPPKAD